MLASSRLDCICIVRCIVIRFLIVSFALLGATHAQTPSRCPELMQLNTDAEASLRKAGELTEQDRCDALVHYSAAWADIDKYARDHGELCGISTSSLNDITESHKRAVRVREDACGGRRALPLSAQPGRRLPFPAESARVGRSSQHWSPTVGGGVRHLGCWHKAGVA
jgi:hypothetical protein